MIVGGPWEEELVLGSKVTREDVERGTLFADVASNGRAAPSSLSEGHFFSSGTAALKNPTSSS